MVEKFQGRSGARLGAVQALYQIEQTGEDPQKVIRDFLDHHFAEKVTKAIVHPDLDYFKFVVVGTCEKQESLQELLKQVLPEEWPIDRLESVLKAILLAGAFELQVDQNVPTPVILNEYVNITKSFHSGKEIGFVNAVLDRLAKMVRNIT